MRAKTEFHDLKRRNSGWDGSGSDKGKGKGATGKHEDNGKGGLE